MIKVTSAVVLFIVVSVECSVPQKSVNTYISNSHGRLTNVDLWTNSHHTRPREQWNSGKEKERWQYIPSINNWQESNDNYRWNDNLWKPMPSSGIHKPTWKHNDVFREISRKLKDQLLPIIHWKTKHLFGRNRLNNQAMDDKRYQRVNYWMQRPNKIPDWHIDSVEENGYKYLKPEIRKPQYENHPSMKTWPQNTAYQNENIFPNIKARPESIKKTKPWYQFDVDGNIWILEQNQPDITSPISSQAVSPGYVTPSSGENTKHSPSTTADIPVLMPYSVPVAVPKPVLVPVAVPLVHNIRFPVEKPVPYPVISAVPQPYEKLVPMSVEVPKIVPFEVPVYTHIYKTTNGKKWHLETKL